METEWLLSTFELTTASKVLTGVDFFDAFMVAIALYALNFEHPGLHLRREQKAEYKSGIQLRKLENVL